MDKLKELIKPDEFSVLKVTKTTVEFVRFVAEVEKRSKLERVISKVNNKMIKLKDFAEMMRVKAAEAPSEYPNRRVWDAFFAEAKNMDEMKPGERPDTMHLSNLPSKWFIPYHLRNEDDVTPSEKIFYRVFEKFGNIRYVDIPTCDPYRKKMKDHISGLKYSSFDKLDWFEGYVQFKDYIGFTKAMDFFRDKKLVHKEEDGEVEVEIRVDFDKTKHLSDASIRRREIVRDRLVKKVMEKEERDKQELEEKKKQEEAERKKEENLKAQKEIRRRMREEKRKAKIMKKLEITGSDEINEKIAREEKKLIRVQRKLEAIRIVEELFRRVKEKNEGEMQRYGNIPDPRGDEVKRLKNMRELDYLNQKEKLHNAVKGRVMLKSILSNDVKTKRFSDSSDSEPSLDGDPRERRGPQMPMRNHLGHPANMIFDGGHGPPPASVYGFPYPPMFHNPYVAPSIYPDIDIYAVYRGGPRGRGRGRGRGGQRGRGGGPPGARGPYPQEIYEPYSARYYNKNAQSQHDDRVRHKSRSYSPRNSSQKYRSRSRSKSRRRTYSRSKSRSYSRTRRSRSRTRSRSRRHSDRRHSRDSRSRSRSHRRKSRSRSRDRSRSRSRSKERESRDNKRSRSKSSERRRQRSRSKSGERGTNDNKRKSRSRSRESIDSSKFKTPRQLLKERQQQKRSRSKSWSLPKDGEQAEKSWSGSPNKKEDDKSV
ncbi:A-kinase anchor protein 17A isoform X2 [Anthonomus grandis grandis]|nr:A-kinase anchor protein 17A isoform X2 [Anthonomus grandis grandis]